VHTDKGRTASDQVVSPPPRDFGPVTRTDIVKFAGAGGDFNPVHHDDEFARRAGYPSVFAMGMFTAGLLGDYVADWLGVASVSRLAVRFMSPVWPGDTLSCGAGEVACDDGAITAKLTVAAGADVRVAGEVQANVVTDPGPTQTPATPGDLRHLLATPAADVALPIERGKVMEFARAIKSENPLHFDVGAANACGFADVIAPLTYSAASAHYNGGDAADLPRALGLDLARVLHGEERWSYVRPPVAGETLHGIRTVAAAWRKPVRSGGAMTFVLTAVDYRDATGAPVLRDETIMIEMPARENPGSER
jgi:acyl dehydratase